MLGLNDFKSFISLLQLKHIQLLIQYVVIVEHALQLNAYDTYVLPSIWKAHPVLAVCSFLRQFGIMFSFSWPET